MTNYKITACLKHNKVNLSLSSFFYTGEGYEADTKEFVRTINSQPMDPEKICRALNNHKQCMERFRPYRPIDNGCSIVGTDPWGNEHLVYIRETEEA